MGIGIAMLAVLFGWGTRAWARRIGGLETDASVAASAFMLTTNSGAGGGVSAEATGGVSRWINRDYVVAFEATGATGALSGVDGRLWTASATARGGWEHGQLTASFAASRNPAFAQRRAGVGLRFVSQRFGRIGLQVTPLAELETLPTPGAPRARYDLVAAGASWEGRRGPLLLRLRVERGANGVDGRADYANSGVEFAVGIDRGSFGLVIDSEGLAVDEQTTSCTTIGLRMALEL